MVPCKQCYGNLLKEENYNYCKKYWNLRIKRAEHSKELVLSVGGFTAKPFKLRMKMQKEKREDVFKVVVNNRLSITIARA